MKRMAQKTRGAAAVELTILMVFLVPTIMYVLFIQDLTWYKLEQQETIVSTPWDYNFLDWNRMKMANNGSNPPPESNDEEDGSDADNNSYDPTKTSEQAETYQPQPVDNVVARNSRRTYCDHTSAFDKSIEHDCKHEFHHTNFAAHQCWLTGSSGSGGQKARQVTCVREKDTASIAGLGSAMFDSQYNEGGYVRCDARLGVTNYYVMNSLFLWSKEKATEIKRFDSQRDRGGELGSSGQVGSHSDAQGAGASESIVFLAQEVALLQDTWAVNRPGDVDPTEGSPESRFHSRMNSYYMTRLNNLSGAAQFLQGLVSDELISPIVGAADSISGDLLLTPHLAYNSGHTREFDGFYTSGWTDNRQQDAYNGRQNSYFGDNNYP